MGGAGIERAAAWAFLAGLPPGRQPGPGPAPHTHIRYAVSLTQSAPWPGVDPRVPSLPPRLLWLYSVEVSFRDCPHAHAQVGASTSPGLAVMEACWQLGAGL